MYPALGLETPLCVPDIFHWLISNYYSELCWFMLLFRPVNLPFCMGFPFWGWGGVDQYDSCYPEGRPTVVWSESYGHWLVGQEYQHSPKVHWKGTFYWLQILAPCCYMCLLYSFSKSSNVKIHFQMLRFNQIMQDQNNYPSTPNQIQLHESPILNTVFIQEILLLA